MITINLIDSNFVGQVCSVPGKTPRLMQYVRNQWEWDGITLFTDGYMFQEPIVDIVKSRFKIGWLQEPRGLHPENYDRSWDVRHKFDAILTYDEALLSADPTKYLFAIRGGCWIPREQWGMHPKTKNISMILSDKQTTLGHKLRHHIADKYGDKIDLYGARGTPIGHNKALALKDYRFTVVIENVSEPNWFCEHTLDPFAFGTIPIYWSGNNYLHGELRHFTFLPFAELGDFVNYSEQELTRLYELLASGMAQAIEVLPYYEITEDWLVQNPLKPFVEALS